MSNDLIHNGIQRNSMTPKPEHWWKTILGLKRLGTFTTNSDNTNWGVGGIDSLLILAKIANFEGTKTQAWEGQN